MPRHASKPRGTPSRWRWHPRPRAHPRCSRRWPRGITRGDYDGKPLTNDELTVFERAGTSNGARMPLLTERPAIERVLDYVIQGNTAQWTAPAFVKELKSGVRFNGVGAVRT